VAHSCKEPRHFPSRLLPKGKSDVNIIPCVGFPFKQYRKNRKDGAEVGNILEMLYNLPREKVHGQDSPFVRTARIKSENLELLTASMTDEQKELLDAYLEARSKVEDMMDFDRFRFAFHFGAQLMAELIEGKGDVL